MAMSLDEFMKELRANVDGFESAYRKNVEAKPDHYPLILQDGNEGLWQEFFYQYMQTGEA